MVTGRSLLAGAPPKGAGQISFRIQPPLGSLRLRDAAFEGRLQGLAERGLHRIQHQSVQDCRVQALHNSDFNTVWRLAGPPVKPSPALQV